MVLIFSLPHSLTNLPEALEKIGHEVVMENNRLRLYDGVYPLKLIEEHKPSIIYNNLSMVQVPEGDYLYIGNSVASARLENEKWETRWKAEEIGFKLPRVLEECTMNKINNFYTEAVYLKPKSVDKVQSAWKIPQGFQVKELGFKNHPAYVEENVKAEVAAKCRFTISNGSYQIEHVSGRIYDGEDKLPHSHVQEEYLAWTSIGDWVDLPQKIHAKFLDLCTRWLDYVVTLGGNYSGEIEAGVVGEDIYWFEQNCRRITYGKFYGDAQTWLDSLTIDPAKALEVEWVYEK